MNFRPESGCRILARPSVFPLVCFSRKTHQQPSAPRKLILGSIKSGPASGLFFKIFRRLRRALFFQNLSAPAAGFVCSIVSAPAAGSCFSFVKLSHLMLLPSLSRLGPPAKKIQGIRNAQETPKKASKPKLAKEESHPGKASASQKLAKEGKAWETNH